MKVRYRYIPIFIIGVIIYTIIGGVVFHFIETKHEKNVEPVLRNQVQEFIDAHPCVNLTRLLKLKRILAKAQPAGVLLNRQTRTMMNISNWNVKNSIFLATQIVGAVGYGSVTPQTVGGKIFTVFFTLLGIPIFVIFAFGVGKPIAKLVRYLERRMCGPCVLHARALESQPVPHNKKERKAIKKILKLRKYWVYFVRVVILFIVGSIFFVLIPAIIFNAIEPWSYGESVYFCYTTVLSVGFGDFVPGDATDKDYRDWYRLATSIYVYIGVAFFVIVFSPIQEALNFRKAIQTPFSFRDDVSDLQSNVGVDRKDGRYELDPERHQRPALPAAHHQGAFRGSYPGISRPRESPYIGWAPYGTHNSAPGGGVYGMDNKYTTSGNGLSVPKPGSERVSQGIVTSLNVGLE